MKTLILAAVLVVAAPAFAAHDGMLGPCQKEAQLAILKIAQINGIPSKSDDDYNKLVIDRVSPEDQGDQVIDWASADKRFTVTTVARNRCLVENLAFNPNP